MPQVIYGLFREASPEAALWGRVALSVGVAGLVMSLFLALLYLRDQVALRRAEHNAAHFQPPVWGPLAGALGEFFRNPVRNAPLSPDAAAEFVIGRLEAQRETTQSIVRYLSYAPLLFGLMGTILALRALLVTSGSTLQQIQPHLAGVFAGTLAGIMGSLLGGVGSLILDSRAVSWANGSQDFVHANILPMLPERRIAVKIEDAVLALIAERARAVTETFNSAMQPVARHLEQVAQRCGTAAEAATKAFSEAARAVREAGDLEVASRSFKSGAHMIDSSAEQLSDATRQTAEVILRVGEIRENLTQLLGQIHESAHNLNTINSRVAELLTNQISQLSQTSESLETKVSHFQQSVAAFAEAITRKVTADSAQLDVVKSHTDQVASTLTALTDISKQISDMVRLQNMNFDALRQAVSEALLSRSASAPEANLPVDYLLRLDRATASFQACADALSTFANGQSTSVRSDGEVKVKALPGPAELGFLDMCAELRKTTEQLQKVTASLGMPIRKKNGLFRRFFGDN